jgi:hypothetical protein
MVTSCRPKRTGNIHSAIFEMGLKAADAVTSCGSNIFHLEAKSLIEQKLE